MMKAKDYENRIHHAIAGMYRRPRSIPALRRRYAANPIYSAFHACAAGTRVPQKGGCKSEPARAEAKDHTFRFPRPCRLERRFCSLGFSLSDQFLIGKTLAHDSTNANIEPFGVIHNPIVVAPRLLIEIAEQMKRFDRNVGALQPAFQERPEVFHAVSVNLSVHVGYGVVDHFMLERAQTFIRFQRVSEDRGTSQYMLPNLGLQSLLFGIVHNLNANLAASGFAPAFQDSHHGGFVFPTSAGNYSLPFGLMHISGFAADVGFVGFDLSREFVTALGLLRKSDPMEHEPGGFLGNANGAGNFTRGNAILAVVEQPNGREPLIQTNGRVLEYGPNLDGELTAGMPFAALPAHLILEEPYPMASASWADDPVIPVRAARYEIVQAVLLVSEVNDCLSKGFGFKVGGFHT